MPFTSAETVRTWMASFSQQIGEALQVAPLLPSPVAIGEQSMPSIVSGWSVDATPICFAICLPKLDPAYGRSS